MNLLERRKKTKVLLSIFVVVLGFLFFSRAPERDIVNPGEFVAYRGGGQRLDYSKMNDQSCGARHIVPSDNATIENTRESIQKALALGADAIHLNIHRTKDDDFVVFHDWTLDCATNGEGVTSSKETAYLKMLDAGYGYSLNGESFPWRDKGLKISTLGDVIEEFKTTRLWLNLKTSDERSVGRLVNYLRDWKINFKDQVVLMASDSANSLYLQLVTDGKAISMDSVKSCLLDHVLYGWSFVFPETCKNTMILIPPDKTKYLWGWPEKFAGLAQANNSEVYVWGRHEKMLPLYDLREKGVGIISGDLSYLANQD